MRHLRPIRRFLLPAFAAGAVASSSWAQSVTPVSGTRTANSGIHAVVPRAVAAMPRAGSIIIDGRLSEAAWAAATPASGFIQSDPKDGQPATQRTEVRFLFDENAIYVGARMFDSLGAAGVRPRLVRRDQLSEESDWIRLFFDTFHDHTQTVEFSLNASGARRDATSGDPSWDPVWESATSVDSLGWVAEMRIPFSQLRYPRDEILTWGLQVVRFTGRLNERSHYAHWMKNETGGPDRYHHLEGIRPGTSFKRLELLPYVVGRNQYIRPTDRANPFLHKVEYDYRAGADLKYLLTQNLTLNATINPDFGQVEADPAVINLSAFETSFPEKRPFFIEGGSFFGTGGFSCYFCSNVSSLSMFYTRRIGRRPQVAGAAFSIAGDTGYVDLPDNTAILGAAKVTGRTRNGWSVGIIDALTREERADLRLERTGSAGFDERDQIIEPRTNYFVGRLKKDLRGGNLQIGGIATSVVRNMNDIAIARALPQYAEAVGMDWRAYLKNRTYWLQGIYAYSQVRGEPAALQILQRSPARYFQRPDRETQEEPGDTAGRQFWTEAFDPGLTYLRGHAGYTRISKEGGNFKWETMVNWRSPGFEVNDIAFLTRADYIWSNANLVYSFTKPTRWYREMWTTIGGQRQQNFDGDINDAQIHAYIGPELTNFWSTSLGLMYRPEITDDRLLRGGPLVRRPENYGAFANLTTDSRRRVVIGFYPNYGRNVEGFDGYGAVLEVRYKPTENIAVNVTPFYGKNTSANQFVRSYADSTARLFYGRRYVLASLEQHTAELGTRVQWTFTPRLSLEAVMTPLFGSVNYYDFKEYARPGELERVLFGPGRIDSTLNAETGEAATYSIDPDGPSSTLAQTTSFSNPDFNFRSLIGNAVLRWEYRPGSTLFVVWQQSRNDSETLGDFDLGRSHRRLWGKNPDNIFLVKANYWLNF